MKKKLLTLIVLIAFFGVASISTVLFVSGDIQAGPSFVDVEPLRDLKHADSITIDKEFDTPHSPWNYPVIDDYTGGLYWLDFVNPFNGTYGNIWVGLDPLYDEYIDLGPAGYSPEDIWLFGYPWTPVGITDYLPAGYRDAITGQDLLEVLFEFDNNIHETDVEYFGMYNNDVSERPGPYGDGTVQIMVFNVKDEFFYDPDNALGFIEGYFWSLIADWGANAFHMDSYQWWRRQGEAPPMIDPYTGYDYTYLSVRTWEYEGTFAHEFQHLIHHDRDPDELSWVDEGCATLAEWLCGYGFSPGHISEYLTWFWDTPLTIWEGFLADYGASFLWTFYMYEHYGGADLLWSLVQDQANGIEGWENALAANGIKRSFDKIFQDWCIANYLDDTSFGKGKYGYYELDLPSDNSEGLSIPIVMEMWADAYAGTGYFDWFVDTYPYSGEYILVGRGLPYTASYVEFRDAPTLLEVTFDGADTCGAAPTSGTHNWYSDGEAWSWWTLSQDFVIPGTGAMLYFSNYFSIEADWDYGYIEVYDYDTGLWTTLPGVYTTTDLGYQQDNPYVPEEREPTTYAAAGTWNCFTGESGGLYTEAMDLTPFAGHTIELSFTYWTDAYTQGSGWYIDDIEIPEMEFYDDCETVGAWTASPEGYGWYLNDEIIYNDFEVSFIETTTFTKETKKHGTFSHSWTHISQMRLNDDTEEGRKTLLYLDSKYLDTSIVMVVANQPGYEHTFGTSYAFTADRKHWKHWWC